MICNIQSLCMASLSVRFLLKRTQKDWGRLYIYMYTYHMYYIYVFMYVYKSISNVSFEKREKTGAGSIFVYICIHIICDCILQKWYIYILYVVYNHCARQIYQCGIIWKGLKREQKNWGRLYIYICIHTSFVCIYVCICNNIPYMCIHIMCNIQSLCVADLFVRCHLKREQKDWGRLYTYINIYISYLCIYVCICNKIHIYV